MGIIHPSVQREWLDRSGRSGVTGFPASENASITIGLVPEPPVPGRATALLLALPITDPVWWQKPGGSESSVPQVG